MAGYRRSPLAAAKKKLMQTFSYWDKDIKDDYVQLSSKPTRLRIIAIAFTKGHYINPSVRNEDGTAKKGFQKSCLKFSSVQFNETGDGDVDAECGSCDLGLNASATGVGYAFMRREQRALKETIIRPLRLPGTVIQQIEATAPSVWEMSPDNWNAEEEGSELPDALHPVYGWDVNISKEGTGLTTKYTVNVVDGGKSALTKAELEAFEEYSEKYNFSEMIDAHRGTAAQMMADLKRAGLLDAPEENDDTDEEEQMPSARRGKKPTADEDDAPPAKKAKKKAAVVEEDDEDEEDEAPPVRGKKASLVSIDDDDEDDETTDDDDTDDEDDDDKSFVKPSASDVPDDDEDDEDEAPPVVVKKKKKA